MNGAVRFRIIDVECDSADPVVLEALRDLLEQYKPHVAPGAVVPVAVGVVPPRAQSVSEALLGGVAQERIMEEVAERPGITVDNLAVAVLNDATVNGRRQIANALGPLTTLGRLVRHGDKLYTPAAAATMPLGQGQKRRGRPPRVVAPEPPPALTTTAPLRVKVPLEQPPPKTNPTGRVEGFVAQANEQTELVERIVKAVHAQPGTTVQALATLLLGSPSIANVRRIDFLVGPLVMGGKLVRTDGRLFASAELAAAAPLLTRRQPGRPAPLSDVDRTKKAFDRIVERFSQDPIYPLPKLAQELFGDETRLSLNKVQVMLSRLVSTERLERVGPTEWRPVGDEEQHGRGLDEDSEEDDADLESNGHPDEDDDQELDLGAG